MQAQRSDRHVKGLGRSQILVLRLLALGERSVQQIERDHFGLSASAAYSAIMRLGQRGLVDMGAGYNPRTYVLTDKGQAFIDEHDFADLDDEDET